MVRASCLTLSAFAMLVLPFLVQAQSGTADLVQDQDGTRAVKVRGGESRVLDIAGLKRVSITDPKVADVAVVSASELRVDGIAPGFTTLIVWDRNGRQQLVVEVAPRRVVQPTGDELSTRQPVECLKFCSTDGKVVVEVPVDSGGALAGDLKVAYGSTSGDKPESFSVNQRSINGFINANKRLIAHHANNSAAGKAVLDLEFDFDSRSGKVSLAVQPPRPVDGQSRGSVDRLVVFNKDIVVQAADLAQKPTKQTTGD